jgi:Zn-dependent protease with chaperone function
MSTTVILGGILRAGYIAMVGLLVTPPAVSLFARYSARTTERLYDEARWRRSLRFVRMLPPFVVTICWSLWDITYSTLPGLDFMSVCFWFGPAVSIAIANLILYFGTRRILGRRWTRKDILRLAAWSTAARTVPLVMVAVGLRTLSDQVFVGLCWLVGAAIGALIAAFQLRLAQGFNPRRVNSGDLHKRAFVLAKRMGVRLRRTYVVPSGRGRLTNAFGGLTNSIGINDDYGKWLKGSELDFVIAHELAHVQQKHGLKNWGGWLRRSCSYRSLVSKCLTRL